MSLMAMLGVYHSFAKIEQRQSLRSFQLGLVDL